MKRCQELGSESFSISQFDGNDTYNPYATKLNNQILRVYINNFRLFHSILYDYIRECSPEDRAELISTLSPLIVPLSNSLPGVNAASICVWQGTNKDKKVRDV